MAPEVIHGQYYSYLADIWSIGIVFHEMLTGNYPFIIEENDFDDK
jgi:serine/threonine protein kinase